MSAPVVAGQSVQAVTYLDLAPVSVETAGELLKPYREAALGAGASAVEILLELTRAGRLAIRETWPDLAALDAYLAGEAASLLSRELERIELAPPDHRRHDAYSIGMGSAQSGPAAVYVLTHVDVPPPQLANLEPLLKQVAEASRREPGAITFEVLQQTSRKNHFTVVEGWGSHAAFVAHSAGPAAREFRAKLGPMLGALYDQRLYSRIA